MIKASSDGRQEVISRYATSGIEILKQSSELSSQLQSGELSISGFTQKALDNLTTPEGIEAIGTVTAGVLLPGVRKLVSAEIIYLTRAERLGIFKCNLLKASNPTNPQDAIKLINKTLDKIEVKYSTGGRDRMWGILDDRFVTYHSFGGVTALTKGHRIEIRQNGSFEMFDRKTEELFLKKP